MNSVDPVNYGKSELIRVEPFVLHFTGSGAILKKLTMAPHPVTQAVIDLSAGACGNRLVLFISCVYISGGQSTQIKYLSKSTDTYNKILLQ